MPLQKSTFKAMFSSLVGFGPRSRCGTSWDFETLLDKKKNTQKAFLWLCQMVANPFSVHLAPRIKWLVATWKDDCQNGFKSSNFQGKTNLTKPLKSASSGHPDVPDIPPPPPKFYLWTSWLEVTSSHNPFKGKQTSPPQVAGPNSHYLPI